MTKSLLTVADLIKQLKELPGDLPVILQRDPEGNGYSPVSGCDGTSFYDMDSREAYSEEDKDYIDENEIAAVPCVIIWPRY